MYLQFVIDHGLHYALSESAEFPHECRNPMYICTSVHLQVVKERVQRLQKKSVQKKISRRNGNKCTRCMEDGKKVL